MAHIEFSARDAVVGVGEVGGYCFRLDGVHASLQLGRVGDIEVVGDTAALLVEMVEMVEEGLHLVAVARIVAAESIAEFLCCLLCVGSFCIRIFHPCADTDLAVDISGESGAEVVGAHVGTESHVISKLCEGDIHVVELLLRESRHPFDDCVFEKEALFLGALEIDHVESRAAPLAGGGVSVGADCVDETALEVI